MRILYFVIVFLGCSSCLSDWLDIKPDKKMVLPSTLQDINALMDNTEILNVGMPVLGEVGTDDFTITDQLWASMSGVEYRNAYIWADNIFEEGTSDNWNNPYQAIFYANLALESLDKIKNGNSEEKNWLRGSAHFYRAWSYFQLAQLFCSPYDGINGNTLPGLPLRIETDINIASRRYTLKETYDLIKEDIAMAVKLLPEHQQLANRPSKAAALGLNAILYLQIGDFEKALENADASLAIYSELIDYNTVDSNRTYPFLLLNKEVLFHSSLATTNSVFLPNNFSVVEELYNEFHDDDLRKRLFFRALGSGFTFRGSYNGNLVIFNGITTDEIMLIKSECLARLGRAAEGISELERLLIYRYKNELAPSLNYYDDKSALEVILLERRKQLIFRGRRWWDLRRLNREPLFAKVLTRHLLGQTYELESTSMRYTLPLPNDVIRLAGIEQNPR